MGSALGSGADGTVLGSFRYMTETAESSLRRNGKVLTRRGQDGNDAGSMGLDLETKEMSVQDARRLEGSAQRTLARNGFEVFLRPLPGTDINFLDNKQVISRYYPHCADVIREASGARIVVAFDHNVRSASGQQSKQSVEGGQQVQGPAHIVHGDYTLTSAPQRLRDLTKPPGKNDTLRTVLAEGETLLDPTAVEQALSSGRFTIINLWRNISKEPVATSPMALCDAASVCPDDLVVFEIHYSDRIGENYFAKHSDHHQWYFYPAMTREEALLIKQWDSAGAMARSDGKDADATAPDAPCTFSFHSAFENPATPPDAPDRWSIEVRCMVLYE